MAFVAGGDIWRVAATGGEASLLVSHPADDSRPLYSPDGTRIAFVSTRTGGGDIYVLTLSTGELRRLTFEDGLEQLDAWSRDSEWIYYHSSSQDLSSMNDVFRIRASGGTPIPVAADRYASEFFASPSPDGKTIAINARGIASRQWWRKGHSHLDISEIWLVRPGTPPSYERITDGGAKEIWPMWTPDGKSLFFVSDRTGVENIWRQPLAGTSRQISAFKDGRVLWPSISHDGKWIVFERDFGIWRMETVNGRAVPVAITLRGASAGPAVSHLSQTSGFDEIALSGDGRKMAFTVRGEIFAASAKDGGDAQRVTRTHAQEAQAAWSPDSRKLAYVSDRGGVHHIFIHDFGAQAETQLTFSDESDASPRFSPDGKTIAFLRGGRSVWLYDLEKKQERQLATGEVGRQPLVSHKALTWSPDSRWIAFTSRGNKGFSSVLAAPVSGGASQPVSFLANTLTRSILWSADGKYLLFDTSQRTEPTQVARVDLILRTPIFREDRFRDLFKPSAVIEEPAAAKPGEPKAPPAPAAVSIVFEQIRRRLSLLPIGLDVDDLALSMDGKTLLLTASAARQENLYTFSLDELAAEPPVARQVTSSTGNKSHAQFAPDGKEVYYLERGRVQIANVDTRQSRTLNLTAEMDVDFHQEKRTVFRQAWSYQRDHFFDDRFNGVRWDALRMQYEPLAMSARTPSELYRIVNLMLGELNASHMGISGPQTQQPVTGQLGLRFDPAALENGQFRVAEVIPLGPAALAGIQTGEYVVAIDNVPLAHQTSVQELLQHKVSKRVELSVAPAAGAKVRSVVVLPVTSGVEKNLLYRAWVEDRRELVSRMSGGRLGYVHMSDMSSDSLSRLYIDLDSENHAREGVVIDIRNNTGGFVNAYALDVFARRPYLTFVERGRAAAPARSVLGQRALELPTILVINQHSLSDAEDFTEGYRRLKLGKVIGEPTAGWIIYTWNQRLIDGSSLRMPRVKVFDNDGQLMELHPRPVDVPIERPVGESYTGKDIQLDTAVRELLQQIEAARRPPTNGEAVR
ncbi:MAG: PD40 domain-containing protein [Acidobacteria bacterium]|nr:PD40 domain-containing protein [Acidobacteriota bacterium]